MQMILMLLLRRAADIPLVAAASENLSSFNN